MLIVLEVTVIGGNMKVFDTQVTDIYIFVQV